MPAPRRVRANRRRQRRHAYSQETRFQTSNGLATLAATAVVALATWNNAPIAAVIIAILGATAGRGLLGKAVRRTLKRPPNIRKEDEKTP